MSRRVDVLDQVIVLADPATPEEKRAAELGVSEALKRYVAHDAPCIDARTCPRCGESWGDETQPMTVGTRAVSCQNGSTEHHCPACGHNLFRVVRSVKRKA
ncbi:MAG: hypothetical protein V4550_18220 [Gemmatimonadota bacterium]